MNTLYVIGNINMETVEAVSLSLKEIYPNGFDTIVFFESPESKAAEMRQEAVYRRCFGAFTKEVIEIDPDGTISTEKILRSFSKNGNKVLDLTNGQKITAAALYMVATLCYITDIYYLKYRGKSDSEYIRVRQVGDFRKLGTVGRFDIIYYAEKIEDLFPLGKRTKNETHDRIYTTLQNAVLDFFSSRNYRNVIFNACSENEYLIRTIFEFVCNSPKCHFFPALMELTRIEAGILLVF